MLSEEDEQKLIEGGGGCEANAPVTFVSRPGLNAEHNRALISVGTSCYHHENSILMLLGEDGGHWRMLNHLIESSTFIDRFPQPSKRVEPTIVSVKQSEAGNFYELKVAFIIPDVSSYTFDTITVYGMRIVGGQRSDDTNYPSLHGSWKPNDRAEFSVRVPKECTDPSKGWNLTFCVGSTAGCYPSSNVLTFIAQKKDR